MRGSKPGPLWKRALAKRRQQQQTKEWKAAHPDRVRQHTQRWKRKVQSGIPIDVHSEDSQHRGG